MQLNQQTRPSRLLRLANLITNINEHFHDEEDVERLSALKQVADLIAAAPRLMPDSRVRRMWDIAVLLTLGFHAVTVPLILAEKLPFGQGLVAAHGVLTAFHVMAVVVSLNTALVSPSSDQLVYDRADIMAAYLRRWGLVDLLSIIPLDCVLYAVGTGDRAVRAAVALRLLRIPHVLSLFNIASTGTINVEYAKFYFNVVPLLRFVFWLVFWSNLAVVVRLALAVEGEEHGTRYDYAMFWCISVFCRPFYHQGRMLSYGQFWYAAFLSICSFIGTGALLGKVSFWFFMSSAREQNFKKMKSTLDIIQAYQLPRSLQMEVLSFQWHSLHSSVNAMANTGAVLDKLPAQLRGEILLHIRMDFVRRMPLFTNADRPTAAALASALKPVCFSAGETVMVHGEIGQEMYFILHGFCEVIAGPAGEPGRPVATLRSGDFFGEVALMLSDVSRTATIRTLTYCDFFRLDKWDFIGICEANPSFRVNMEAQLKHRLPAYGQRLVKRWFTSKVEPSPNEMPSNTSEIGVPTRPSTEKLYPGSRLSIALPPPDPVSTTLNTFGTPVTSKQGTPLDKKMAQLESAMTMPQSSPRAYVDASRQRRLAQQEELKDEGRNMPRLSLVPSSPGKVPDLDARPEKSSLKPTEQRAAESPTPVYNGIAHSVSYDTGWFTSSSGLGSKPAPDINLTASPQQNSPESLQLNVQPVPFESANANSVGNPLDPRNAPHDSTQSGPIQPVQSDPAICSNSSRRRVPRSSSMTMPPRQLTLSTTTVSIASDDANKSAGSGAGCFTRRESMGAARDSVRSRRLDSISFPVGAGASNRLNSESWTYTQGARSPQVSPRCSPRVESLAVHRRSSPSSEMGGGRSPSARSPSGRNRQEPWEKDLDAMSQEAKQHWIARQMYGLLTEMRVHGQRMDRLELQVETGFAESHRRVCSGLEQVYEHLLTAVRRVEGQLHGVADLVEREAIARHDKADREHNGMNFELRRGRSVFDFFDPNDPIDST